MKGLLSERQELQGRAYLHMGSPAARGSAFHIAQTEACETLRAMGHNSHVTQSEASQMQAAPEAGRPMCNEILETRGQVRFSPGVEEGL